MAERNGNRPASDRGALDPLKAFATDWDRTLTLPEEEPAPAVRDALARLRAAGLRVVIVTGREYENIRPMAERLGVVDGLVAENGAVVDPMDGRAPELFGAAVAAQVREALIGARVVAGFGRVVVSAPRAEFERLRALVGDLPVHLVPNVTRVMVLPEDVDKASGVRSLLALWRLPRDAYAAIGDGENDAAFLRAARISAAVANATLPAKEAADVTLRGGVGDGVIEFADGLLSGVWMREARRAKT